MKLKLNKRRTALAIANAAAIAGALILSAAGGALARSQTYNYSAERWKGGSSGRYAQISCFFSGDAGFTKDTVPSVRGQLLSELKNAAVVPEEGQKLVPDAYSAPMGTATVRCDITGKSEAEITAVGGDFFLFRDFKLINGSYFFDSDLMQDGAVIDRQLAWSLYGSDDVSGMNIYINGVKYYISGVIDTPQSKDEKKCAGDMPRAYISFEAASSPAQQNASGETGQSAASMSAPAAPAPPTGGITCYEFIVPEPVENFGMTSIKKIMGESYKGKLRIVRNTGRFEPKKRSKALKKLPEYAIHADSVQYPYWENASRTVEFRLTIMYGVRRWLLLIPALTLAWLIIKGYSAYLRNKSRIKRWIAGLIDGAAQRIKSR